MTEPDQKPIEKQFRDDFADLVRKTDAARSQFHDPAHVEKPCTEFEKQWTEKLEDAKLNQCIDPMKTAVDAVRTQEEPDLAFTIDMRPAFRLTPEATRRMAQHMQKDDRAI